MKVTQHQLATILSLVREDFISGDFYDYFNNIGVGAVPKTSIGDLKSCFADPDQIPEGKHIIFTTDDFWGQLGSQAQAVFMDHEFGHILDGQLDSDKVTDGGGGAIVVQEWEFAADDNAVKHHGKEVVLKALLKAVDILYDMGQDAMQNEVIIARLKRLGYTG